MNCVNKQIPALAIAILLSLPAIFAEDTQGSDDYMDKPGSIRKWLPDRMPLPVYVKPGDDVPGFKPEYIQLAKNALDEWSAASNGEVRFRAVDDPQKAAIKLRWTDDPAKLANVEPLQIGSANYFIGKFGVENADVVLLTIALPGTPKITDDLMHSVLLHEIGHALGLPHSENVHDVMYPNSGEAQQPFLSARDSRTISKLYSNSVLFDCVTGEKRHKSTDPGIRVVTNEESAAGLNALKKGDFATAITIFQKLYESNPGVRAFQADYVAVLNNAGKDANDKLAYDTAIGYLEKALEVAPDLAVVKQNLVISLNGKGNQFLTVGKADKAEVFYKQALELTLQLSPKELLKMTVTNYCLALTQRNVSRTLRHFF